MGSKPWHYFTPYQTDINAALQALKEQEFRAGRYGFDYMLSRLQEDKIIDRANNSIEQQQPTADELIDLHGSLQAAIDAVVEESDIEGTLSILDMKSIAAQPTKCAVCLLSKQELQGIFKTTEPTRQTIESALLKEGIEDWESWERFWDSIGRIEGRYILVFENGQPKEIFWAGYSFD
ncbi:MAG: hypothetical protein AAGA60_06765 [Cyanobacteria bacterium P01_E01_bin.42]